MLCSNSLYHGDESEIEYDDQELKDYEDEERGIEEWKMSRID
jgi:hypothetical protein